MDIEPEVISFLSGALGVPVKGEVPYPRPEKFVTVELTGGQVDDLVIDHPMLAIQSWAPTKSEAKNLARYVDEVMRTDLPLEDGFLSVRRESLNPWPGENKEPRYQGVYAIVTYAL